jgi:hypothetical protein
MQHVGDDLVYQDAACGVADELDVFWFDPGVQYMLDRKYRLLELRWECSIRDKRLCLFSKRQ